jgi:hypothetical protein
MTARLLGGLTADGARSIAGLALFYHVSIKSLNIVDY